MLRALKYFFVSSFLLGSFALICQSLDESNGVSRLFYGRAFFMTNFFFLASYLSCWLILQHDRMHSYLTHDNLPGIQKIHGASVPRVGGLALLFALLVGLPLLRQLFPGARFIDLLEVLMLSSLPVFLGGFMEDLLANIRVPVRLGLSFLSSSLFVVLSGAIVPTLNVQLLDQLLTAIPLGLSLFTVFAVAGVTHSFNLVDGLNGLASGVAVVINTAAMATAYAVGDHSVVMLSLLLNATTLGFLVWNWPRGKIFLGDGGAYMLGFMTAAILVLLVQRNPVVSAWLPLVLVGFPVFETLYSIYRRKHQTKKSPGAPDNLHMHQLVYRLVVNLRQDHYPWLISSNSLTTLPILLAAGLVSTLAVCFFADTRALMVTFLVGVVLYVMVYRFLLALSSRT